MKTLGLTLMLMAVVLLAGCVQYDHVAWVRTEPTVVEYAEAASDAPVADGAWYTAWLSAPPDVARELAKAPVAIVHEVGGVIRGIVGGVVDIETNRIREATDWTRWSLNRKEPIRWIDRAATPKLMGGATDEGSIESAQESEVLDRVDDGDRAGPE